MPYAKNSFYTPDLAPLLNKVDATDKGLLVEFTDGREQLFSWFWVRDHGIDDVSLDQGTLQRMVDTFAIPRDIGCKSIKFDAESQLIDLLWSDDARSTISAYMLASVVKQTSSRHDLAPHKPRVFWDKDNSLLKMPEVEFQAIIESDEGLLQWLENIHVYGFSLVHNVPPNETATTEMAMRIGRVQETIFGKMWPLSSDLTDHGDTAYTTSYLEPHTDGTYYDDAAGLQMFNCLEIDCKGGESIQVDGFAIAQRIKREDPKAYKTLSEVVVPAHYMETAVHLRAERPTFKHDREGELVQVSFNNYDRAPFLLSDQDDERFHHAYALFHRHALDQDNWLKIPMQAGTTLIFDNWRNMHGRMGYVGKRVFYGCYHSRAEYESKLRVLRASQS
ncbi:MAG: trimethyllysine dioxygenase [Cryomorphaceae bacterium]|jgi:trimethyllysine dioxygenase